MLPQLAQVKEVAGFSLSLYIDPERRTDELWVKGEDLGMMLGFSKPRVSINNIFDRNKEELEPLSSDITVMSEAGKRKTRFYNEHGSLVIAMLSQTSAGKQVRMALLKIYEEWKQMRYQQMVGAQPAGLVEGNFRNREALELIVNSGRYQMIEVEDGVIRAYQSTAHDARLMKIKPEKQYKPREAAEIAGCSENFIYRQITNGRIEGTFRIGRLYYIPGAHLLSWLQAQ